MSEATSALALAELAASIRDLRSESRERDRRTEEREVRAEVKRDELSRSFNDLRVEVAGYCERVDGFGDRLSRVESEHRRRQSPPPDAARAPLPSQPEAALTSLATAVELREEREANAEKLRGARWKTLATPISVVALAVAVALAGALSRCGPAHGSQRPRTPPAASVAP